MRADNVAEEVSIHRRENAALRGANRCQGGWRDGQEAILEKEAKELRLEEEQELKETKRQGRYRDVGRLLN